MATRAQQSTAPAEGQRFRLVMIADVAAQHTQEFALYEKRALELVASHAGRLETRVASPDRTFEVHVLSFADQSAYESFLGDPERARLRLQVEGLEIEQRLEHVVDIA